MEHEIQTYVKPRVQIKHPKLHKITNTYLTDGFHHTGNTGETAINVNDNNIITPINLASKPTRRHPEVTPTSSTAANDKESCRCCVDS